MNTETDRVAKCRESLIKAAKTLFARNGLDGTTVRDIAQLAGVNLSMVSYYFDGKEGLYRACLEEFGQSRLSYTKAVLDSVESTQDFKVRLRLILTTMLTSQVEERDLIRMLLRELEAGLPVAKDVFENTFLKLTEAIIGFFKLAQKKGIVRADLDPHFLTVLLHGTMCHMNRLDHVNQTYFKRSIQDPKFREKMIDNMLSILLTGALVESEGGRS
jgi:AcrR family transcriptional regulator